VMISRPTPHVEAISDALPHLARGGSHRLIVDGIGSMRGIGGMRKVYRGALPIRNSGPGRRHTGDAAECSPDQGG